MDQPEKPVKVEPPARAVVPWGIGSTLLLVVALYFLAQIIAGLLISIYPQTQGWDTTRANDWLSSSVSAQFVFLLIAEGLTIAGIVGFIKFYKTGLSSIGFKRPRFRDAGYALLLYPLYFLSFAIIAVAAHRFIPGFQIDQEQQIGFNDVQGTLQLTMTFVSLVILPPLTEELLFRGVLFTSLHKYLKWFGAAVITSLIFAGFHLPEGGAAGPLYVAAIDTFILSMFLCWLRQKTGSLWPGIFLHALKNGIAFASLFIFAAR